MQNSIRTAPASSIWRRLSRASWAVFPLMLLATSCQSSVERLEVQRVTEPVKRFHPAPPPPVSPNPPRVEVLTPEVTEAKNRLVANGDAESYVYFAVSEQDWLSMAQWQRDVLRYVQQVNAILKYYREEN